MSKVSALSIAAVYTITCIVSGKVYVGQAINVRRRWESHRHYLGRGTHRNHHLQRSWDKHGAAAFVFEVVAEPVRTIEQHVALAAIETAVLSQQTKAFNLMIVGEPRLVASAETRAKWSEERLERWADPEYRERLSASHRERHADKAWSDDRAASIREARGTPESRAATSAQITKLWADPKHRAAQGVKRKANWEDPAYREQQRASRIASAADPEVKARRSAALKAAWARRKAAKT